MMSPEVLIYLQKIKTYMSTNDEANNYFIGEFSSDDFFNEISSISEKNYQEKGDPMLSREQFEEIRNKIRIPKEETKEKNIFFDLKDFGKICLN